MQPSLTLSTLILNINNRISKNLIEFGEVSQSESEMTIDSD